jgi:hypothetical protein
MRNTKKRRKVTAARLPPWNFMDEFIKTATQNLYREPSKTLETEPEVKSDIDISKLAELLKILLK